MASQPIPKKIIENNPNIRPSFNTLLVDGSNLLHIASTGDDTLSSSGKPIGGIFQFFLQLKLILRQGNFRYVYVFWDGINSGNLRYALNPEYKANRDKEYDETELSDYMKAFNAKINSMKSYFAKKKGQQNPEKLVEKEKQKEIYYWQRDIIMQCLEELFIRQCESNYVEADDLISYYVRHKKPNERIVIVSTDKDLTQLISNDVIIYMTKTKSFINTKNHTEITGINYQNVVLKKMICGDMSDNIKGIKGVGEKTLLENFPELATRKVELDEIIERSRKINEDRAKEKKKPLKWAENIVNAVTDGIVGDKIYEVNKAIIDLSNEDMMTTEGMETIQAISYNPMDPDGRSLENLYKILLDNDITKLKDPGQFSSFFTEFMHVVDNEKRNIKVF